MSQSAKIDFVASTSLTAQTPSATASKRGAKNKTPQTLVLFVGQDLGFGAATRELIGAEGEALIKKAAAAAKFKGKGSTALDIIAPSGFAVDRLLAIGTGPASEETKSGKGKERDQEAKPDDYLTLGGFALSKLGAGACATVLFDLPRPPKFPAAAAAEFAEGIRLRDYKFDLYKTKKKDDEETGPTEIAIAVEDTAAARREAKSREAVAEGVLIARSLVNEPANVLYPEEFAKRVQELEKLGVEVKILDEAAMTEFGMGALLGVGQG
jgi:leucyl aminopeptidase